MNELLLAEVAATRYVILNLFDASAKAAQRNENMPPEDVLRIRDAADSRKRATARKLIEEFMALPAGTGGAKPLDLFVFLLGGIVLFNAGFAVYLRPLLYTLTPLQRYYLPAYLASSWEAKDPAAQTDVQWIWKFKAKEIKDKDKTGSRTKIKDRNSDEEDIPMEFAREEDLVPRPVLRPALGRQFFAVHHKPASCSGRLAGDQQGYAGPRERGAGRASFAGRILRWQNPYGGSLCSRP